jgi:hypothetical protein
MATPLYKNLLYKGDVNIIAGYDIIEFGYGDLNVNNNVFINGTSNSISVGTGSLQTLGGLSISKDSFIQGNLNVLSISNLNTTNIIGATTITGSNAVNISVGSTSQFTTTSGNLNLSSTLGLLNLFSGSSVSISGTGIIGNSSSTISLNSTKTSNFTLNSTNAGENLTVSLAGTTDSSLILTSSGINTALQITTSNPSGNILLANAISGNGSINLISGSTGINLTSQSGNTNLTSNLGTINLRTNGDYPINICTSSVTTNAVINIKTLSNNINSINLSSNNGGILLVSNAVSGAGISIQSADTTRGIAIGTTLAIPINIGNPNSTTIINGNLDVKGTVTTIESTTITVKDNIILVNSAPSGISDGGLAVKRYQPANDTGIGAVVSDTSYSTGISQGATTTTIVLSTNEISTDNFYKDYWIKIISGSGINQVRQIKSYNGSTKVATIYGTSDQLNQVPIQGLDFTVTPINSGYSTFDCGFTLLIWDESNKQWNLQCSVTDPSTNYTIGTHFTNLQLNQLTASNIKTTSINGILTDILVTVILNNNSSSAVVISGWPSNYGVFDVSIKPLSSNSVGPYAKFVVGRTNGDSTIGGNSNRVYSGRGSNGEQLMLDWLINSQPTLKFQPSPNTSGTSSFVLRITPFY